MSRAGVAAATAAVLMGGFVAAGAPGADGVTAPPAMTAPLRVTGRPMTLAIDPAVLEPGELTQVTGTGFTPGTPVILSWQLPDGSPLLGTMSVAVGTGGTIGGFFLVMPNDLPGPRQLVATQGAAKVTANVLVDAAPTQPSSGDRLVYRG